jgi:hypothetical protein
MYHSGTGGGGLHSLVHTLRDQFGSHCAELIPGVATVTATIASNATATTSVARRQTNLVIVGLQKDPSLTLACLELNARPSPKVTRLPAESLAIVW